MGSALSLTADAQSPDGSGPCVMSPLLEDAGIRVEYEQCVAAWLQTCKRPPLFFAFQWEASLKAREIEETDSGSHLTLKVKIVLDGEKLKAKSLKETNPDVARLWGDGRDLIVHDEITVWNKKLRTIDHTYFNTPRRPDEERKMIFGATTTFLDPLAVTFCANVGGTQIGNADVRGGWQATFDAAVGRLMAQINERVKVVIDEDKQIIKTTTPMEPYTDYESFLGKYLEACKRAPEQVGCTIVSETDQESEGVSVITYARADGSDAGFAVFEVQRSTGMVVVEYNLPDNPMGAHVKKVAKITKSPLSYETWMEDLYTKSVDDLLLERESIGMQNLLEPPSSGSWFG